MADTNKGSSQRTTIEQHGLMRQSVPHYAQDTSFMERFIDTGSHAKYNTSWSTFRINDVKGEMLNWYAVSPSLQAYVTMCVGLVNGDQVDDERITLMRYRDMIVDNYLAAGGNLETLRYIGTKSIINEPSRLAIENIHSQAGEDFSRAGVVEFLPREKEFLDTDPFARGIQSLVLHYANDTGGARVKRFIFISEGLKLGMTSPDLFNPSLHMVVELCRPGDEGYWSIGHFELGSRYKRNV
ncbi:hypothetical protein F5Y19DRAFT_208727 [Xylariaceae sp. FL1651]|nr:hypothetical protein F5Y19DRAFT_208727 [Xylariaceae sp. FL1651]